MGLRESIYVTRKQLDLYSPEKLERYRSIYGKGWIPTVSKQVKTPEEWRNKNLEKFLNLLKDKEYFMFVVNRDQLEDFERCFLSKTKDLLIYRSEKFNNNTHRYTEDNLTLFIFQKK